MLPIISRQLIYPLQESLLHRPTFKYLRELEQTQWYSREDIEALQLKKLQALLTTASTNCPWHANRIREANINSASVSMEEFRHLPTMDKKDAQLHGSEMTWKNVPSDLHQYTTGGSSGQPLIFQFGRQRQASDAAGRIRARRWWGVNVGDPEVYLWGAPVELNKTDKIKTIRDRLLNQLVLNAFAMSPEMMGEYLQAIKQFKPKCIYGYASSIALLAAYAQNNKKIDLPDLKVICTTGEPLYPEQRKLIQDTFGVPVANEFGSRDIGFTAHETPDQQILLISESIILEVLDPQGNPVAPGETGEAVMTGLCSEAQPFIRYRTGDMISLSSEPDKQGRGLHVIKEIEGRSTDFLVHKDGSIMHALSVIYILRDTEGVEQFKIIQHAVDEFEILVVANDYWNNKSKEKIIAKFKTLFGQEISITVSTIIEILPEASGKIRQVVSLVNYFRLLNNN
ncbi:MAG: AMP-binding protein [Methylomarinum sp.]|nr:AMP-binding protein [Methylomarinum sp.]